MKYLVLLVIMCKIILTQDNNFDGVIENSGHRLLFDINGDGIKDYSAPLQYETSNTRSSQADNSLVLNFIEMWQSPAGAFTNSWDGYIGYIDNDTLLDIAGFTFSPAKFYIWEQSPTVPDSFYLVQEFIKSEGGSFSAIVVGDTDGDNKKEIIAADILGIARIYIYENDGDNVYINQNTQTTLVHPSNGQGAQGLYIADLNKNGKKEIVLLRGSSSPGGGEVRIWEHTGSTGNPTYTNIYTYSTITYIFSKGGLGDGDNDGWDEVYLTFGGLPVFNTFIRRIKFDSASGTFQHLQFEAPSIGFPGSYRVYDLGSDNINELIMTGNSNSRASCYIFRNNGPNSFIKLDSIFENSDNNNMLSSDIKVLTGSSQPTLLMGSFNGRIYTYRYNGTSFIKDYENLNFPGPAIRRVYWLPALTYDGYFNTWSSSSSNGTYYVFKRNDLLGFIGNNSPVEFRLYQNYPNPFNPVTKFVFQTGESGFVKLVIFDLSGKLVVTAFERQLNPGRYEIEFNASGLASGIYFYKLIAENHSETKKMVLIK